MDATTNTEPVKLTDRELAIIRGENPDELDNKPDSQTQDTPPVAERESDPGTESSQDGAAAIADKDVNEGKAAGGGKDAAEGTPPATWVTDDIKALAESYSLKPEALSRFSDADDFLKAAAFFENTGVKPPAAKPDQATPPADDKAGKPVTTAAPPAKPNIDDLSIDPQKYIDGGYDEDTVRIAKALKAEQESRDALTKEFREFKESVDRAAAQAQYEQYVNAFNDVADTLNEKRFGRSIGKDGRAVELPKEAIAGRSKLWDMTDTLVRGIVSRAQAAGQEPKIPSLNVLLRLAEKAAFAEEIRQEEAAKLKSEVAAQSRRRRPVGSSRPISQYTRQPAQRQPAVVGNVQDYAKELANSPELVAKWDQLMEGGK